MMRNILVAINMVLAISSLGQRSLEKWTIELSVFNTSYRTKYYHIPAYNTYVRTQYFDDSESEVAQRLEPGIALVLKRNLINHKLFGLVGLNYAKDVFEQGVINIPYFDESLSFFTYQLPHEKTLVVRYPYFAPGIGLEALHSDKVLFFSFRSVLAFRHYLNVDERVFRVYSYKIDDPNTPVLIQEKRFLPPPKGLIASLQNSFSVGHRFNSGISLAAFTSFDWVMNKPILGVDWFYTTNTSETFVIPKSTIHCGLRFCAPLVAKGKTVN